MLTGSRIYSNTAPSSREWWRRTLFKVPVVIEGVWVHIDARIVLFTLLLPPMNDGIMYLRELPEAIPSVVVLVQCHIDNADDHRVDRRAYLPSQTNNNNKLGRDPTPNHHPIHLHSTTQPTPTSRHHATEAFGARSQRIETRLITPCTHLSPRYTHHSRQHRVRRAFGRGGRRARGQGLQACSQGRR